MLNGVDEEGWSRSTVLKEYRLKGNQDNTIESKVGQHEGRSRSRREKEEKKKRAREKKDDDKSPKTRKYEETNISFLPDNRR